MLQGGLTLPSRDYYLDPSPRMADIRDKYRAHVAAMLRLAQITDPDAKAERIMALETKIAEAHAPIVDTEDVHKGNNHWTRTDFAQRAPGLDWNAFFEAAGLAKQAMFVAWQPGAITKISALVRSEPVATWREYLTYHAITKFSVALPKAFGDENFAFFGKVLTGIETQRDRQKRGVDLTSIVLGEEVGKLYVAKYFPPSEKARAQEMIENELAAFARRIDNLSWMMSATKEKAKAKLAVLKVGVGYPDHWRDSSSLEIKRDDLFGNMQRYELRVSHAARAPRHAGRSRRVGDDVADRRRGQPAGDERDELPGGDPAAAVLRSESPGGDGLRRDGLRDRPRDQPGSSPGRFTGSTPRRASASTRA